jgi:stalled ribosome rescue protein Dom34
MGAYHTLDLEVNRKFTIRKHFDSVDFDRIDSCCDPAQVCMVLIILGIIKTLFVFWYNNNNRERM